METIDREQPEQWWIERAITQCRSALGHAYSSIYDRHTIQEALRALEEKRERMIDADVQDINAALEQAAGQVES